MKQTAIILLALCYAALLQAQPQQYNFTYTLEEVLELAKEQSPEALRIKNTFLASFWQYRSYKASQLPSLSLSANIPDFSRRISETTIPDPNNPGKSITMQLQSFTNRFSGVLSLQQNLPTGGIISLSSSLMRRDFFGSSFAEHLSHQYVTTPVSISLSQSLFGVNQWKWDRKIEPLRYEEAKRNYLKQEEGMLLRAIQLFFDLAAAQQNLAIAEFNQANNDTLHKLAQGRYNMGTIGENDLLQSELNYLTADLSLNEAQLNVETSQNRLRSYLGFNEQVTVSIIIPTEVPKTLLDVETVLLWAKKNNPDLLAYQRQLLEAEKRVVEERASTGVQANISLEYGLNKEDIDLLGAYRKPLDMQTAGITLRVPILDWGRGKGRVRMAKSNQQVVQTQVEQALADFEQDVVLRVRQYNMQEVQFFIAAKSDTIAQKRYEVSKQRFLIDKITITDMNNAQLDRDRSQQNYVAVLRNYWNYYYLIRQLALYDFIRNTPLDVDFDLLVK